MKASELTEEANAAAITYQVALAKIGAKTIEEAIALWRRMKPADAAAAADKWLGQAVQMILSRRSQSQELALAYYRLVRALQTGTTIPDPNKPEPRYVTLQTLRSEFAELVKPLDVDDEVKDSLADIGGKGQSGLGQDDVTFDPERIEVEELDVNLSDLIDEQDAAAVEQAEQHLQTKGPDTLNMRRRQFRELSELADKDKAAMRLRRSEIVAELQTAATAERLVMNGGRGLVWGAASGDRRVIGWVRRSKTGTPCGFCAMLISRGLTLYRSEASAMGRTSSAASVRRGEASEGDRYHDNCRCVAFPVYARAYYDSSELFEMNREFEKLWPEVTKGKKGRDALNAWRRYINKRNKTIAGQAPASWDAPQGGETTDQES